VSRISSYHGTKMGVCVEASLDLRDQRSCMCSLSVTGPWWRSSGGHLSLQRVAPRRDTALVTTTQVSAACFGLLSHVIEDGGVLCRVCCSCSGVCSCGGVCFGPLCTNVVSSYMT
jgi:hypothetical protein